MPRALTAKGEALLASMPGYYRTDPNALAVIDSGARELQRIEDFLLAVIPGLFASRSDDSHGLLSLLEKTLNVPMAAPGASIQARRNLLLGRLRSRLAGRQNFVDALTTALGGSNFTLQENTPGNGQLTITLPFAQGSFTAAQVIVLARAIAPAHIQIVVRYQQGFLVGESGLGDPL